MNNVLGLFDQAYFTGERVTGATGVLQCVWVYDRAIDIDGLRRFHRHLHGAGYRAASSAHRCLSPGIAGSRPAFSPTWRSSRSRYRATNSTLGSASRPTPPPWMRSTDPNGTSRCSRSLTGAPG